MYTAQSMTVDNFISCTLATLYFAYKSLSCTVWDPTFGIPKFRSIFWNCRFVVEVPLSNMADCMLAQVTELFRISCEKHVVSDLLQYAKEVTCEDMTTLAEEARGMSECRQ
jgi:hypothetical protein